MLELLWRNYGLNGGNSHYLMASGRQIRMDQHNHMDSPFSPPLLHLTKRRRGSAHAL